MKRYCYASMNQTAVIILSVTAAINLTAITVLCWIKAVNHRAYFWLGALFGASTLAITSNLLIYLGYEIPWLFQFSTLVNLSWGAYLIGFFRHLTRTQPIGRTLSIWFFTPSILYLAYLLAGMLHPVWLENTIKLIRAGQMTEATTLFNYIICLYAIGSNVVLLINTYRKAWSKNVDQFCCQEARQLLWPMLILLLGAFVPFMARMDITYIITYMPVFGQLYFLYLFFRLSNPRLALLRTTHLQATENGSPSSPSDLKQPKYANLRLTEERMTAIAEAIETIMRSEKPYLHLNYTLHDLSEQLHVPTNVLSMVINSRWNLRFTDYINRYRVIHAEETLCSQDKQRKTIEAIALDSGFSNRTSFYQAFKKETGLSPNEFAKKPAPCKQKAGRHKIVFF